MVVVNHRLNFIVHRRKELWFLKNKFKEAEKLIGRKKFTYIIDQNVPGAVEKGIVSPRVVISYLRKNRAELSSAMTRRSKDLERRWRKLEHPFFDQMELVTGAKWKHRRYNLYLIASCFWGGDYGIGERNIYVNPLLKHGDSLYVIFHELSHIMYWEYILSKYSNSFVKRNYRKLWELSEIMVNYPLMKIDVPYRFPVVIPPDVRNGKRVLKKFRKKGYIEIIQEEIKRAR